MRRLHLFEFEDLGWVPRSICDGGTDLLDLGFDRLGFYDGVAPKLDALLSATGARRLVDLCSGGGGGSLQVRKKLRSDVELLLSDRYPNEAAIERIAALGDPRVRYRPEPVDAMQGGGEIEGVRTMSGALHHFTPGAISSLLAGVVRRRAPLCFFDVAASPAIRRMPLVFAPLLMSLNMGMLFLGSLVLLPLVRPFRLARVALTYLLPLIPALVAWDGTVSALRAYTPSELLALARTVPGGDSYEWDAGVAGSALYLVGRPR